MLQLAETQNKMLPKKLVTAEGKVLDLERLTQFVHVILITVSSLRCPIGPQLLRILKFIGLENEDSNETFTDPFTGTTLTISQEDLERLVKLNRILLRWDTLFLILLPGNLNDVLEARSYYTLRNDTNEGRVEFLADEEMALARSLGLTTSNTYIYPAIFHIQPKTLQLSPIKIGLSPGYYGYHSLISFLAATRLEIEVKSLKAIIDSETRIEQMDLSRSDDHALPQSSLSSIPNPAFPAEIMETIFEFLNTRELEKVSSLSREWRHIVFRVWRNKVRRVTGSVIDILPKDDEGKIALVHTKPSVHQQLNRVAHSPSITTSRIQRWRYCHRPKIPVLQLERKLLELSELLSIAT
ncbi:hypothetical protein K493DRAFT_339906 [Basidiobolus meristosporus CBS 931.73]|uniref:F-box domain-containing protein n=1 Tax=Basidiobolus meristosporus CBS 931.73 TaxID=1314790 RepID=A0A1Y1XZ18_9FUNG|nr:hypothetical protein K493DRAFT_339906 [Basidiobolus meristosporus CBS 931.73]|eukprot:ORX90614.1 hypothetical protein K493DRAFT_339906 [Basidiobolus meristosporus CBS 931.73]